MKKLHFWVIAFVGVAAVMLIACGQSGKQNVVNAVAETDTAGINQTAEPASEAYVFTQEGIGPVVLGAVIKDLPEQLEGLYVRKAYVESNAENPEEESPDAVDGWYFYDADGNTLFTAEDNGKGGVGRITVVSPDIKTAEGAHVGMTKKEMSAVEGAKEEPSDPEADYQRTSYQLHGISVVMDWEDKLVSMLSVERW